MIWSDFGDDVRPHMIGGWSLRQAVGHLSQQIGSASNLRGCSSLSDGVRHYLDVEATFLPPLSGIGKTSPRAWRCAHYGYGSLQFCGICFSQWFSSEEISGLFCSYSPIHSGLQPLEVSGKP